MALKEIAELFIGLRMSAAEVKKGVEDVKRSYVELGRDMQKIGGDLTKFVTLPMIGIGAAALKSSTDFNRGMANVASLIPGATDRVQELKTEVQDMALELGTSTDDLAEGLYEVVSAFGDTADSAKILEINARAAKGGISSTTEAIKLTSAVTKAYGDTSAEAVQDASDLALLTVRLGQTTFPELAASIGRVTPFAKELNVSQQELFATMATATGVTGGAAEVSTQLRGVLQSLMAPTADMAQLLKQLGFESGQALIEQKGLKGAIDVVVQAAQSSGQPLQKYMSSIEGQALATALAGSQAADYAEKLDAMQNAAGATDAAFREQTEGVNAAGHAWNQFKAEMQVTAQQLGDELGPALIDVLGAAKPLIGAAGELIKGFSELGATGKILAASVLAIAAAAGPTLVVLGKMIVSYQQLKKALDAYTASQAAAQASQAGWATKLAGFSVLVGTIAAAFVTLKRQIDGTATSAERLITSLTPIRPLADAFRKVLGDVRNPESISTVGIRHRTSSINRPGDVPIPEPPPNRSLTNMFLDVSDAALDFGDSVGKAGDQVRDVITDLKKQAAQLGKTAREIRQYELRVKGATEQQIEQIEGLERLIEGYRAVQGRLRDHRSALEDLRPPVRNLTAAQAEYNDMLIENIPTIEEVSESALSMGDVFSGLGGLVREAASVFSNAWVTAAARVVDSITGGGGINEKIEGIGDAVKGLASTMRGPLKDLITDAVDLVGAAVHAAAGDWMSAIMKMANVALDAFAKLRKASQEGTTALGRAGGFDPIDREAINRLRQELPVVEKMYQDLRKMGLTAEEAALSMIEKFRTFLVDVKGLAPEAFAAMSPDQLFNTIHALGGEFEEFLATGAAAMLSWQEVVKEVVRATGRDFDEVFAEMNAAAERGLSPIEFLIQELGRDVGLAWRDTIELIARITGREFGLVFEAAQKAMEGGLSPFEFLLEALGHGATIPDVHHPAPSTPTMDLAPADAAPGATPSAQTMSVLPVFGPLVEAAAEFSRAVHALDLGGESLMDVRDQIHDMNAAVNRMGNGNREAFASLQPGSSVAIHFSPEIKLAADVILDRERVGELVLQYGAERGWIEHGLIIQND